MSILVAFNCVSLSSTVLTRAVIVASSVLPIAAAPLVRGALAVAPPHAAMPNASARASASEVICLNMMRLRKRPGCKLSAGDVKSSVHEDDFAGDRARRRSEQKERRIRDRKSTRLNSSHVKISYAVFCLKKKT